MKLRINWYLAFAVLMPLILIILNLFPSWSQYAKSNFEIFLDLTLGSIVLIFYELSFSRDSWRKEGDRIIAWLFFAILLTDVNQKALSLAHYIVTGLSALFVFARMVTFYPKGSALRRGNTFGAILAASGFLVGFLTPLYSTAVGEWIYALIAGGHVFVINNELDQ